MTVESDGAWIARAFDESTGKQTFKALGDFTELPDHQRFDVAQKAAQAWFDHLGRGGSSASTTARTICDRYLTRLRAVKAQKAADDAAARFARYVVVHTKLANTEVSKLTPAQVEAWRRALKQTPSLSVSSRGKPRSDSTLNRDMTCFRAAPNLAYADGLTTSDFAWRSKLVPLKNADQHRELYLDQDQRRKFIEVAASDLAIFLRGLALLPLRPGALAGLTAGDYNKRLQVLKIGKDKHGKDRKIKLPPPPLTCSAKRYRTSNPALRYSPARMEKLGTRMRGNGLSKLLLRLPNSLTALPRTRCVTASSRTWSTTGSTCLQWRRFRAPVCR